MVCVNACADGAQSFVSQDYACSSELKWGLFAAALIGTAAAGAATYLGRLPKNVGVGLTLGGAVGAAVAGFWPTKAVSVSEPTLDLKKLVGEFDAEQGALVERLEWKEIKGLRLWKKGEMVQLLKLCPNLKQIDVTGYPQKRDHAEVMKQLAVQPALEEIHCSRGEEKTFLWPDKVSEWDQVVEKLSEGKEVPAEAKAYFSRLTHFSGEWSSWSSWSSDDSECVVKIISHMPRLRTFDAGVCPDDPKVWEALQACPHLEEIVFRKANERVIANLANLANLPAQLQLYLERLPELRFEHWKDHLTDDQWPELVGRMPNLKRVDFNDMPAQLWTAELVAALPSTLESFKGSREVRDDIDWDRSLNDLELALIRLEKGVPERAEVGDEAAKQLLNLGDLRYPMAMQVLWDGIISDDVDSESFRFAQAQLTDYDIQNQDFGYEANVAAALTGAPRLEELTISGKGIMTLPACDGMWERLQLRELTLEKTQKLDAESMKLLVNQLRPSVIRFEDCGTPAWTGEPSAWEGLQEHYDICFRDDEGLFVDDTYAETWTWDYLKEDPTRLSKEVDTDVTVALRRKEG